MECVGVRRCKDVELTFVSDVDINYVVKNMEYFCRIDSSLITEYSFPSNGVVMGFVAKESRGEQFRDSVVEHLKDALIDGEPVTLVILIIKTDRGKREYIRKVEFSREHYSKE